MRDTETIPFHPLAAIFPLIEGIAFRELVEDVRVHGLREPIILHEGQILDGRNRYRACQAAQVAARYQTYSGKDPLAFVVSANLHRRHLDASQRGLIAAQISEMKDSVGAPRKPGRRDRGGRLLPPRKYPERARKNAGRESVVTSPKALSFREAGNLLNVSEPTVAQAKRVLTHGVPELIEAVRSGAASVSAAQELVSLPHEQQRHIMRSGGPKVIATIGGRARAQRIGDRRVDRAAEAASTVAVFDHLKIGDGRSIGNVRVGEIERLAESLRLIVHVLCAVLDHGRADHSARIRDVVKESTLAEMIAAARDARQDRSA